MKVSMFEQAIKAANEKGYIDCTALIRSFHVVLREDPELYHKAIGGTSISANVAVKELRDHMEKDDFMHWALDYLNIDKGDILSHICFNNYKPIDAIYEAILYDPDNDVAVIKKHKETFQSDSLSFYDKYKYFFMVPEKYKDHHLERGQTLIKWEILPLSVICFTNNSHVESVFMGY